MKVIYSNRLIKRIVDWAHNHRVAAWIIGSVALILIAGITTFFILSNRPSTKTAKQPQTQKEAPVKYYSRLTGAEVANKEAETAAVTGVMIENSLASRPQSGLKNSGLIFEAIAEGGITRFLVFYQAEKPQTIGPVRSLRLYDVEWLKPFNASIAHVGGSAAALAEVRNGQYRDLDQFFNSRYYTRVNNRPAPHNVYTSFENLDALNNSKGYKTSNFTGLARADEKPVKVSNATEININISGALYNSVYTYDSATNSYTRSQAGQLHVDREDGQIAPKVVVGMMVNESTVFEDGYREKIDTTGNGTAYIFQNGTIINATWHRATTDSQIIFTDDKGKEIALVRGQTWIAAVPNNGGSVTWN